MKNISIERLVLAGFAVIAILFLLLGGIAWQSAAKSDEASSREVLVHQGAGLAVTGQVQHAAGRITEVGNARLLEHGAKSVFQQKAVYVSFVLLGVSLLLLLVFLFLRIRRAMHLIRGEDTLLKNAKLEDASRMKSEFMAHMSHELRTPINAIMGFSELLKDGRLGKLTKAQTEYVSDIYSSGQHLLAIVNNILDLSKIEAGKMTLDLKLVEISELIDSSSSILKEKGTPRRLLLDVQPGLGNIHLDAVKTRQILYNLLSNAAKFTPDDGKLKLCARRVLRSQAGQVSGYWPSRTFPLAESEFMEFVEISVADSGIGIPPDGLERLFQPYSRVDSGWAHKFEGAGLGLMLVKHLAELHGGTVAVESAEGQGSRFIVWLPLRADAEMAVAPEELMPRQVELEAIRNMRKTRTGTELGLTQQRTFVNA